MTKHREVTGALACVSPYTDFLWTPPLMSGPSTSFPHILLPCFSSWYFSPSAPYCLSLAQTNSVSLHISLLLRVPLVTQGTLKVTWSPNSNLNAKTAEIKLCNGAKSIFHHIAPLSRASYRKNKGFSCCSLISARVHASLLFYPLVRDYIP